MYKKFMLALAVLLVFSLSGCQGFSKNTEEVFYGTAEMEQIDISAEAAGVIKELAVAEGDSIKKGDVIAVVNSPESSIKAEQAELGVKSASNELEKVKQGAREEEIAAQRAIVKQLGAQTSASGIAIKQGEILLKQAEINTATALETYNYKKKLYDDTVELYKGGTVSKQELDTAEYNMNVAKNTYDNTVKAADSARTQLEIQQAQLESLKQQQESANQKLAMLINGAVETSKTAAELGVKQAEKSYQLSSLALEKTEVKAETEGVVSTVNYSVGEYVMPGSSIVTISNPKNLWVKIYVPEKLLPQLKLKQEVTIANEFIKESIKGTIANISSNAEYTPMNIVTKEERERLVYAVKIQLTDNADKLKAGMLLDVHLK